MKVFLKKHWLILILLAVASLTRFTKLSDLYYFMLDEERDSFIASKILRGDLTLIGGSVPGGLFLGPLYFYITAVFLFFSRLNPLGLSVIASSLGVFSVFLLYKTCELFIKEKLTRFFIALLYASSYLISIYNRTYWPLTFAPIVTILTINFIYRIVKLKESKYIIPLALVQLLGMQSDPSNFSSLIAVVIFFIFYKIWKTNKNKIAISLLIILIAHLPLVAFDLRHNFYISKGVIKFFSFKEKNTTKIKVDERFKNTGKTFNLVFNTFSRVVYVKNNLDVIKQITISPTSLKERDENVVVLLKVLCFFLTIIFLIGSFRGKNVGLKFVSLQFLIIILGIMAYSFIFPGYMHEWFLNVFWPGFCIIFVFALMKILKLVRGLKYFGIAFLIIVAVLNINNILKSKNSLGFSNKQKVISYVLQSLPNKDFYIEGSLPWTGYEYLFRLRGVVPKKSIMDEAFNGWLYNKEKIKGYPDKLVIMISPWEINNNNKMMKKYLSHEISRFQADGYLVLIVDNKTHWR